MLDNFLTNFLDLSKDRAFVHTSWRTASINGSSIELSEDGGVYSGSFAMPGQASSLEIDTGTAEGGDSGDGIDKD